jgi:hypothetical protein
MQNLTKNTTRRSRERTIQLRERAPKGNVWILNTKAAATLILKMNRTIIGEREKQAVKLERRLVRRSLNKTNIRQGRPVGQNTLILTGGATQVNR